MPMILASIDSPSRTANASKNDSLALKNGKDPRSEVSEFGLVMSGVMAHPAESPPMSAGRAIDLASDLNAETPPTEGQELAETPLDLPGVNSTWGGDFLKAIHLGPHLNVITAETAAPDEQSLEAFARSQGLDETAVQWLMGTVPGQTTTPLGLPTQGTSQFAGTGIPGIASTASPSGTAGLLPTGTGTGALLTSVADMPTASAENPMATGDAIPPDMTIGRSTPNSAALTAAALWAMAQPTDKARTATPTSEVTAETPTVAIALQTPAAPAAVWMLRHAQPVAPGKEAAANKTGIAESELDLSDAASPEMLESLGIVEMGAESGAASAGTHPTPLSGHHAQRHDLATSARLDAANADTSAQAPESGAAQQRSDNVQNLAEKMGQAVGQRILSEIEKGQWHLKLSLRPATLGHIEVEMRMRSGELDAVFTTSQAVTRELLQDGMSKLKDTLNQMGMDVASLQVGDGQTQQRGGESTPGQMSKSTNTGKTETSIPVVSAPVSPPRMKMGQDGWDVLV
jgi:flagellar hook-length control protein FliK